MELDLGLRQSQTLSAQQLQSMEILRMSMQELLEHIEKVSLENPVIEVGAFDTRRSYGGGIDPAVLAIAAEDDDSLFSHIADQLDSLKLKPALHAAAISVAEFLDENGYITESAQELAALLKFPAPLVSEALEIIRRLDPAGVGASSLGHCIALQLARTEQDTALAERVALDYLERVAKGQTGVICRELDCTQKQLSAALSQIRSTNPRPCAIFSVSGVAHTITPDIIISRGEDGKLIVRIGESLIPAISISGEYAGIRRDTGDAQLKSYLSEKVREAKWLIGSIERRGATLRSIAAALVETQLDFFEGNADSPAPLTMTALSDRLEVNVSTVSRAVQGKYLRCDAGTFPLSHFFSRSLRHSDGISVRHARELVAAIIASEDKARPMSDMAVSRALESSGHSISRRTVAKYRFELGIPPASARKKLQNQV